jgi:hypothetical protein
MGNKLLIVTSLWFGLATNATSYTYFFEVTDLIVNPNTQHAEIVDQFTSHDIENAIAEIKKIHFSAEHKSYNTFITQYFEQ